MSSSKIPRESGGWRARIQKAEAAVQTCHTDDIKRQANIKSQTNTKSKDKCICAVAPLLESPVVLPTNPAKVEEWLRAAEDHTKWVQEDLVKTRRCVQHWLDKQPRANCGEGQEGKVLFWPNHCMNVSHAGPRSLDAELQSSSASENHKATEIGIQQSAAQPNGGDAPAVINEDSASAMYSDFTIPSGHTAPGFMCCNLL